MLFGPLEHVANRFIKVFDERLVLCVANAAADSWGPPPPGRTAVVYLTWRLLRDPRPASQLTMADIREISQEVVDHPNVALHVSRDQVARGMGAARRLSQKEHLRFYR
jgi:hypothetical protein